MNAIRHLWRSLIGLSGAIDRLTGLILAAGDALNERLQLPTPAEDRLLHLEGDGKAGRTKKQPS